MFGGLGGGGPLRDTWRFKYVSDSSDELCDGMDRDGDKHVDDADPDCVP